MWIPSGQIGERRPEFDKCNHCNWLECDDIDLPAVIWQYKDLSDRSAMRIASSPTLRIAAGLLVAVLLSVVGYQVARRLSSHGPEALLKQADGLSRFLGAAQTEPSHLLIRATTPSALSGAARIGRPQSPYTPQSDAQAQWQVMIPSLISCSLRIFPGICLL